MSSSDIVTLMLSMVETSSDLCIEKNESNRDSKNGVYELIYKRVIHEPRRIYVSCTYIH